MTNERTYIETGSTKVIEYQITIVTAEGETYYTTVTDHEVVSVIKPETEIVEVTTPSLPGISFNQTSKTFSYDANGKLLSITDGLGTRTFQYNSSGYLEKIEGTGYYKTKVFSYDSNGNLTNITIL